MTRSALRRTAASFLFLLLSLTALAAAAPARSIARPTTRVVKSQSISTFLWNQILRLWQKTGGSLDPSGQPQTSPNSGSSLDPSGFLNDAGGSLDPDGAK